MHFSGGSRISHRGAWTSWEAWNPEAVTFRKFCMSKRKNLDRGGRANAFYYFVFMISSQS